MELLYLTLFPCFTDDNPEPAGDFTLGIRIDETPGDEARALAAAAANQTTSSPESSIRLPVSESLNSRETIAIYRHAHDGLGSQIVVITFDGTAIATRPTESVVETEATLAVKQMLPSRPIELKTTLTPDAELVIESMNNQVKLACLSAALLKLAVQGELHGTSRVTIRLDGASQIYDPLPNAPATHMLAPISAQQVFAEPNSTAPMDNLAYKVKGVASDLGYPLAITSGQFARGYSPDKMSLGEVLKEIYPPEDCDPLIHTDPDTCENQETSSTSEHQDLGSTAAHKMQHTTTAGLTGGRTGYRRQLSGPISFADITEYADLDDEAMWAWDEYMG